MWPKTKLSITTIEDMMSILTVLVVFSCAVLGEVEGFSGRCNVLDLGWREWKVCSCNLEEGGMGVGGEGVWRG